LKIDPHLLKLLTNIKWLTFSRHSVVTTNSLVDKIGERYRLNNAIVVKLYHPVKFAYLIVESRLFRRIVTFLIIKPSKYTYLLAEEFLVNNIYGSSITRTDFFYSKA